VAGGELGVAGVGAAGPFGTTGRAPPAFLAVESAWGSAYAPLHGGSEFTISTRLTFAESNVTVMRLPQM
jgi:hypothetical protein